MTAVLVWTAVWGLVLAVCSWRLGALGGRRAQRRRAAAFARRSGLPAGEPDPALVRRVVRRQRFVQAGITVGLVASTQAHDLWVVAIYAGLALGAVADRLLQPPVPPGAPRVAHGTDTRLTDYVPRWLLGAAVVAAAVPPLFALLWVAAPRTERDLVDTELSGGTAVLLVLAALAALAASLGLARLVVRRPAAAGTPWDLATDDALRAQAVRDSLHLSAATSVATAYVLSWGLVEQDVDGALRAVGGWFPFAALLLLLVVAVGHEVRGPRHWRSRLHPELARDPVRSR